MNKVNEIIKDMEQAIDSMKQSLGDNQDLTYLEVKLKELDTEIDKSFMTPNYKREIKGDNE